MRPRLEFVELPGGTYAARVGMIEVAHLIPRGLGAGVYYVIRLPLPSGTENRMRRAAALIEAKRQVWLIASEWFVAVGVLNVDGRLRCDERLAGE